MNDEILISSKEDSGADGVEFNVIKNIAFQIQNTFGEFTGNITTETDYILEYIKDKFQGGDYNTIEDFENVCNISDMELQYNILTNGIVEVFKNVMGVKLDLDREILTFSDIYDLYVVLVLSLKDTIIRSTKNYYNSHGRSVENITMEEISDYCLSDEFSANDHFIKNASLGSGNASLINIQEKIDDFLISIEQDVFVDYLYRNITEVLF